MKVAIIGCGSIGRRHISNFLTLGCDVIAYNRSKTRRDVVKKLYKISTYDNLNEIALLQPDLAVICSPNIFHLDHSLYFAKKKINLFIEKPLSLIDQNLTKLKSIAKKNNG